MSVFSAGLNGVQFGYNNPDTGDVDPVKFDIAEVGELTIKLNPFGSPMVINANPIIADLFSSDHFTELFKAGKAYDPQFEVTMKGNVDGEVRWFAIETMPMPFENGDWGFFGHLLSDAEMERQEAQPTATPKILL